MDKYNEESNTLLLNKASYEDNTYSPTIQSANTLFHFFRKRDYLLNSLAKKALFPRYYGENVQYLKIKFQEISYPMLCFCDINIHRLSAHLDMYGKYGIAFSKPWGIEAGIQPIQYINPESALCRDISAAFSEAISKVDKSNEDSKVEDYLLTQMFFIKPIEGTMPRNGAYIKKNFTDECEWRYIPNVEEIDFPQVVIEDDKAAIPKLNKSLQASECSSCWLKFEYPDVKYIILPTWDDFDALCTCFDVNIEDTTIKSKLLSKVIIWDNAREDF